MIGIMAKQKTATSTEIALKTDQIVENIVVVRGIQVILDSDIAEMYGVETKILNRAVKRNEERFPDHFRFQLTDAEWENLRFQLGTSKTGDSLRFQSGTLKNDSSSESPSVILKSSGRGQHRKYLPYVFTEQGVAMLSAVLRSETAVKVSIRIMEAFVQMRRYFLQNAELFQKIEQVETRQLEHIADSDEKFNRIFNALDVHPRKDPQQGIFFNGQIFDAYAFASDLIRRAEKELVLIDNYIDDSVLTLFSKRKPKVVVTLYTRKISKTLQLDLDRHNAQYPPITLKTLSGFHDRFLMVDQKTLYHIGASLKDLGKQCFAFSRMDDLAPTILNKLK